MQVLIVGFGSIGKRHLSNLCGLQPTRVLAYRQPHSFSDDLESQFNSQSFFNIETALEQKPDFAIISNPTSMHIPMALKAARSGCHLFIEKPLSHSTEGVDELVEEVKKRGLIGFVAMNMRFHPGLQQVKTIIEAKSIGRVLSICAQVGQYLPDWHPSEDYRQGYSARNNLGGGVILDLIHELDYVSWILGDSQRISCMAGHVSNLEIDTEDIAEISIWFKNGAIGHVHLDYLQRAPSRTCQVIGTEGTLLWDYFSNEVRLFQQSTGEWQTYTYEFDRNDMYLAEMIHFLDCLTRNVSPEVDIAEGARVLRLALLAKYSSETGKAYDVDTMKEKI